jgi:hypothetical protein
VIARVYDYVVIDVGNMITAVSVAALYAADTIFLVANPDVPSIRNAQRLVERVRQLGAGSERVRILLNRVTDQQMIAPKQIETALGYSIHQSFASDYRTVATALNSGVPLTMTNHSEIADQFSAFTRQLVGLDEQKVEAGPLALPGSLLNVDAFSEHAAAHATAARRRRCAGRAASAVHRTEGERPSQAAEPAEPRGARDGGSQPRRGRDPVAALRADR